MRSARVLGCGRASRLLRPAVRPCPVCDAVRCVSLSGVQALLCWSGPLGASHRRRAAVWARSEGPGERSVWAGCGRRALCYL